MTYKKKKSVRKKKFVVWLRNNTSKDDDESIVIWAHSREEAQTEVKYDKSRFYIRAVLTAAEAKFNYYG